MSATKASRGSLEETVEILERLDRERIVTPEVLRDRSSIRKGRKLLIDAEAPGWLADTKFAYFVGEDQAPNKKSKGIPTGTVACMVQGLKKGTFVPLHERTDLFIDAAFVADGRGGVRTRYGQTVYEDNAGNQTVLDPDLRCLFNFLRVARIDGIPDESPNKSAHPLAGLRDGELIAVVMPLKEPVRQPTVNQDPERPCA